MTLWGLEDYKARLNERIDDPAVFITAAVDTGGRTAIDDGSGCVADVKVKLYKTGGHTEEYRVNFVTCTDDNRWAWGTGGTNPGYSVSDSYEDCRLSLTG